MEKAKLQTNLDDVASRFVVGERGELINRLSGDDAHAEMREFCMKFIASDPYLVESLKRLWGVVGVGSITPFLISMLHLGLIIGARFSFDYGCPEAVKGLFKDNPDLIREFLEEKKK